MKVVYSVSQSIAHPLSLERNKTNFELITRRDGSATSIVASGEVDIASAQELATALDGGHVEDGKLILDLSGVTFIDSTGLSVLITASQELAGRLQILPSEPCLRLARLTGLRHRLPFASVDEQP